VEDPDAFARTAFIEALARNGVTVTAPSVAANDASKLSATILPGNYPADTQVAAYDSAPFAQTVQLVLKVTLNLGANLCRSLLGLTKARARCKRRWPPSGSPDQQVRRRRFAVQLPDQRQRQARQPGRAARVGTDAHRQVQDGRRRGLPDGAADAGRERFAGNRRNHPSRQGSCVRETTGPVSDIATDVSGVFEDEATISSIIYETL
jgi:hypothetical protein